MLLSAFVAFAVWRCILETWSMSGFSCARNSQQNQVYGRITVVCYVTSEALGSLKCSRPLGTIPQLAVILSDHVNSLMIEIYPAHLKQCYAKPMQWCYDLLLEDRSVILSAGIILIDTRQSDMFDVYIMSGLPVTCGRPWVSTPPGPGFLPT